MRAVVQRVSRASVTVSGEIVGAIDKGLLVYLAVALDDTPLSVTYMADKITKLRVFEDSAGKMGLDVSQSHGALLVVSQFTLMADVRHGRRPDFTAAMPPERAESLYLAFIDSVRHTGITVSTGIFRADMKVDSVNDGPVTLLIDSSRAF